MRSKKVQMQHFAQNAFFARRCYPLKFRGAAEYCEVEFYGNDFIPRTGYQKIFIKLLYNERCAFNECACFRSLYSDESKIFGQVDLALQTAEKNLKMQKFTKEKPFFVICECIASSGFITLPGVDDLKNYSE